MINLSFALEVLEQFGGKFFIERNMGASSFHATDDYLGFGFSKTAKNGANHISFERDVGGYITVTFWRIAGKDSGQVSSRKGVFFTDLFSYVEGETGLDLDWSPKFEKHRTTYIHKKQG